MHNSIVIIVRASTICFSHAVYIKEYSSVRAPYNAWSSYFESWSSIFSLKHNIFIHIILVHMKSHIFYHASPLISHRCMI